MTGTFDAVPDADGLAVAISLAVSHPDAVVAVILEVRHERRSKRGAADAECVSVFREMYVPCSYTKLNISWTTPPKSDKEFLPVNIGQH